MSDQIAIRVRAIPLFDKRIRPLSNDHPLNLHRRLRFTRNGQGGARDDTADAVKRLVVLQEDLGVVAEGLKRPLVHRALRALGALLVNVDDGRSVDERGFAAVDQVAPRAFNETVNKALVRADVERVLNVKGS